VKAGWGRGAVEGGGVGERPREGVGLEWSRALRLYAGYCDCEGI